MRILETLARLELTDGLDLADLVHEAASRLRRDATVVVVLSAITPQAAVALGNLRRRGFAVTALVSAYHIHEFERIAGPLATEGIPAKHFKDQADIVSLCREYVLR